MRTLILVALLASVGTSASYAQGDADSDVEAKILATEHMWGQAYVSKDPKALERILDDAFVNIDSDGVVQNKAEAVAEVSTSTIVQFLTESMVVHLHGNTAIVTGIFQLKGVDHGKPFAQRERFVDTWLYKNGQWISIAGLVTRIGP
ncbi:MAG TPA: nuclear transport factor 2 family protein [Candidatus Dormibacteraeota bacterium]|nr:nuclear transport factor 2 family protein [Candidatus Dormibacteraeota bacterium]